MSKKLVNLVISMIVVFLLSISILPSNAKGEESNITADSALILKEHSIVNIYGDEEIQDLSVLPMDRAGKTLYLSYWSTAPYHLTRPYLSPAPNTTKRFARDYSGGKSYSGWVYWTGGVQYRGVSNTPYFKFAGTLTKE